MVFFVTTGHQWRIVEEVGELTLLSLEQFPPKFRKYPDICLILLFFAVIGLEIHAIFSANQMQNLNQSRLVTGVFPRFSQIACFSSSSHWGPDRPLWLLLFRFNDSWSKCALSQSSLCNSLVTWLAYPGCTTSRWSSPRLITQEAKQTRACP